MAYARAVEAAERAAVEPVVTFSAAEPAAGAAGAAGAAVEVVEAEEAEEAGAEASLPAASGGERRGGQQGGGQQRDGHRSGSTEATREGDRLEVRD